MDRKPQIQNLRVEHRGYLIFPRIGGDAGRLHALGYSVRNEKGLELFAGEALKGEC